MKQIEMLAAIFFALSFSAWLGRSELHTDDTGVMVGLVAMGGFLLAMVEPRRPWIWGLIVPAGVILVNISKLEGGDVGSLLALAGFTIAVANVGAYLGAFVRRSVARV